MPPAPWPSELRLRLQRLFWLKLLGTSAFTWLFFVAYFALLKAPVHPVTTMPLTPVDGWISFQPWALVPYLSLWLYIGVAPGLQRNFANLFVYGCWAVALSATGLLIFYAWPTQIPTFSQVSDAPGMALLKGVDAAGNACPSMHVAISLFSAVWIERVLAHIGAPRGLRAANALWFIAIAHSTVAVRQHVVLDVLGGLLLGGAFAWASLHWSPREPR
jgi:hypothetical protein